MTYPDKEKGGRRPLTLEDVTRELEERLASVPPSPLRPKRTTRKKRTGNSWSDAACALVVAAVNPKYSVEERLKAIGALQRHLSDIENYYRERAGKDGSDAKG